MVEDEDKGSLPRGMSSKFEEYTSVNVFFGAFHLSFFSVLSATILPATFLFSYMFPWYFLPFFLTYVIYSLVWRPELKFGQPRKYIWDGAGVRNSWGYFPLHTHFDPALEQDVQEQGKDAKYIFVFHPHGVMSEWRLFAYNSIVKHFEVFSNGKFKGVRSLAASVLFRLPIVRELALWSGCVDAGKSTCVKNLKEGYSLTIMLGGIEEQLATQYQVEHVKLDRFGFAKLALEHNVKVVPVYCFGANDLFYTPDILTNLRKFIGKKFWTAIPVCWAYGPFIPFRVEQNIVFGKPLSPEPGEEVESLHRRYVKRLQELFDENKARFGIPNRELVLTLPKKTQ